MISTFFEFDLERVWKIITAYRESGEAGCPAYGKRASNMHYPVMLKNTIGT